MKTAIKVCGLTSVEDARMVTDAGADFLGFIFYPKSPRALSVDGFREIRKALPGKPWVYVQVNPEAGELQRALEEGFALFQVHCTPEVAEASLPRWLEEVGSERLWLALKRPAEQPVPAAFLEKVETFLVDTYRAAGFGGTGETGDWGAFRQLASRHPGKKWVLAGGLGPNNVREAVLRSGARIIDVNSGVESAPGRKDRGLVQRLFEAL